MPPVPYNTTLDYIGTARGRIGYAFDRWMPYVTGGFAWGHPHVEIKIVDPETGQVVERGPPRDLESLADLGRADVERRDPTHDLVLTAAGQDQQAGISAALPLAIAVLAVALARWIELSWIGRGLRALHYRLGFPREVREVEMAVGIDEHRKTGQASRTGPPRTRGARPGSRGCRRTRWWSGWSASA